MSILFVSNCSPPFEAGGYQELYWAMAERLLARGREIRALTSDRGVRRASHGV